MAQPGQAIPASPRPSHCVGSCAQLPPQPPHTLGVATFTGIHHPKTRADFDWITVLRAPAIAELAREDGPLQMSLFDTCDLAEITHPDYPGERLIACRNPLLAAQRARKRDDLLAATEKQLVAIKNRVDAGALSGADKIGVAIGKDTADLYAGMLLGLAST